MRALVLILAILALLTFLPAGAQAQQQASVTIVMDAPLGALRAGETITLDATAIYTSDLTGAVSLMGTPVMYTIAQAPEWATITVSPANDVFPTPTTPPMGLGYSVARSFTITISVGEGPAEDTTDVVEIAATTSPGPLGRSTTGRATAPVAFDAVDEPCDELHASELLALATQAAEAYESERAGQGVTSEAPTTSEDDLTVQNTSATPLSLPWVAVAGFALVGSGIGLVLRKRLGR